MLSNPVEIDATLADARRRAMRHGYEDGLSEIAAGALFAVLGLLFAAETVAPAGSFLAHSSALLLPVLVIGGYFLASRAVRAAKERISYPRTGFAAYPQRAKGRARWIGGIVAAAMGAVVAALFVNAPASLSWIPALDGIAIGVFLLVLGARTGIVRFHALAATSVLVGAAVAWRVVGDSAGSAWYFGGIGAALVIAGAWALARYLREAPARAEEGAS